MFQRKEPRVATLLVALHLGYLRTVAAAGVSQACVAQPCFSGVTSACGSCLPTSSDTFCEAPCQPSWGGSDVVSCLGQAGDDYWLQTIQSLNQKCGLPPIPKSADGAGGVSPETTPATGTAPATQPVTIRSGGSQSLAGKPIDPKAAGEAAAAAGKARGAQVAAEAEAQASATRAEAARQKALGGDPGSEFPNPASAGGAMIPGAPVAGVGTGGTAAVSGSPVSSAIASFGCAINAGNLSIATSSACVLFITNDNDCPMDCASEFKKAAPLCRNTMVQEAFYGATWRGVFQACKIPFSTTGQTLQPTPADLATTPAVASAASTSERITPRDKPLLAGANLLESQSGAVTMVSKPLSVILLMATLLLVL